MERQRNSTRADPVTELLGRPLSARSVIASFLLGTKPPRATGARLVRWCGLFGISEGAARVALSRMTERGELRASEGAYELVGRVRQRQPAQEWSLAPRLRPWRGTWRVEVVSTQARPATARAELRDAMRRLRRAALREGVWVRPDNLPKAAGPVDATAIAAAQCHSFSARLDTDDAPTLAARLFATHDWARRARVLARRLGIVSTSLAGGDLGRLADGFVTGAAALVHVRADPLLPRELLPSDWPGSLLRDAYREYQGGYSEAVGDWFRTRA